MQAQEDFARGRIDCAEFKRIEDRAVGEAVALQESAGLEVVTDGEMRRQSFQSQMTAAVEGFGEHDLSAFLWGEWHGDSELGDRRVPRPSRLGVVGKLRRRRHLCAEEFTYLRARTRRIGKVTLPSASLWANFWSRDVSRDAYPTLDEFLEDVTRILREEVAELVRLGCAYIQIDAPQYALFLNPETRRFYESLGWSADVWLAKGAELDNAVMEGFRDVTFGLHICRGNQESRWLVAGGYEPLIQVFQRTRAQRLLLEYDDERSGSFKPLAAVPREKMVVLGLVSTKSRRRETPDELRRRVEEAGRWFPMDRLALSPQCGFASSVIGNRVSPEDQAYKLRIVVQTADSLWPASA